MQTPTHADLEEALKNNDLEAILEIEEDLNYCLNSTRARARMAFTPHAREVAEQEEKHILNELQIVRQYRQRVDLIINDETNKLQVELALSKGMSVVLWVKKYGEKFRVLWNQGVREDTMKYLLYKE